MILSVTEISVTFMQPALNGIRTWLAFLGHPEHRRFRVAQACVVVVDVFSLHLVYFVACAGQRSFFQHQFPSATLVGAHASRYRVQGGAVKLSRHSAP